MRAGEGKIIERSGADHRRSTESFALDIEPYGKPKSILPGKIDRWLRRGDSHGIAALEFAGLATQLPRKLVT